MICSLWNEVLMGYLGALLLASGVDKKPTLALAFAGDVSPNELGNRARVDIDLCPKRGRKLL
jgi:hypothetical protein